MRNYLIQNGKINKNKHLNFKIDAIDTKIISMFGDSKELNVKKKYEKKTTATATHTNMNRLQLSNLSNFDL